MKKEIDFDKIKDIIEKIEKGALLNKEELLYKKLIDQIKIEKGNKYIANPLFKAELKKSLLDKYVEIYSTKDQSLINSLIVNIGLFMNRFKSSYFYPLSTSILTFGFIFIITSTTFNFFNSRFEKAPSVQNYMMQEDSSEFRSKEYSKKSVESQPTGMNFGTDEISSDIKGNSVETFSIESVLSDSLFLYSIIFIVSVFGAVFIFRRNKKQLKQK